MTDERELNLYYLRIHFSNLPDNLFERIDEQQENINLMKRVVELNPVLSAEERNILNMTYKNAVTSRRNALCDVCEFLKMELNGHQGRVMRLTQFKETLLTELKDICTDLINLINGTILPGSSEPEQRVYFEKMKGDYYRYICENRDNISEVEEIVRSASQCYQTGLDIARSELQPTNPTFLGLVLNYSVFLYEIMDHRDEAIELAARTFSDTIDLVDGMEDASYSETTMILRLLNTNQVNWVNERNQAA